MEIENFELLISNGHTDTNVEFLTGQEKEEKVSVLGHVFKSIFVEIPKDFLQVLEISSNDTINTTQNL